MRILKKKELIACKSSEGPFVNTIQSSAEHKRVRDTLLHLGWYLSPPVAAAELSVHDRISIEWQKGKGGVDNLPKPPFALKIITQATIDEDRVFWGSDTRFQLNQNFLKNVKTKSENP